MHTHRLSAPHCYSHGNHKPIGMARLWYAHGIARLWYAHGMAAVVCPSHCSDRYFGEGCLDWQLGVDGIGEVSARSVIVTSSVAVLQAKSR